MGPYDARKQGKYQPFKQVYKFLSYDLPNLMPLFLFVGLSGVAHASFVVCTENYPFSPLNLIQLSIFKIKFNFWYQVCISFNLPLYFVFFSIIVCLCACGIAALRAYGLHFNLH